MGTDPINPINPIEWLARRNGLGLPQHDLARVLGVEASTIEQWETGQSRPHDPTALNEALTRLEDELDTLIEAITNSAEHSITTRGASEVILTTYRSDTDYWAADPVARRAGIPASLHRVATATTAHLLRAQTGASVRITTRQTQP